MPAASKRKTILLLALFGIILALVAAALPRLDLQPGYPLPYFSAGEIHIQDEPDKPPINYEASDFLIYILIALLVVGLVWTVYLAIRGIDRKEIVRKLLKLAAIFLIAAAFLAIAVYLLPTTQPVIEQPIIVPVPPPMVTAPLGTPPQALTWLVGAALAVGAALLAVWFFRSRPAEDRTLLLLGLEAEKARQALLTGMSLRDVILECYRRMSRVLQEENGIQRQAYMTTGEFERLLAAEGFPAAPVHQLTVLFDAVRYGRWQPGLGDDQMAIDCLEAITQYARFARTPGEDALSAPRMAGGHD